jgi:SAM-dependent methyltransferase
MEKRITPGLRYAQTVYEEVLSDFVDGSTEWLDLGCGRRILSPWQGDQERQLVERSKRITGIDYDLASLQDNTSVRQKTRADISHLPFKADVFDLVNANMVVEHLRSPLGQFNEINRVLRPGGLLVFHTPNALGYQTVLSRLFGHGIKRRLAFVFDGRAQEDVFPTYYRANTRQRVTQLAGDTGFEIVEIRLVPTTALFAMVPPLAAVELVWLRLLQTKALEGMRTNLIAVLRKRSSSSA